MKVKMVNLKPALFHKRSVVLAYITTGSEYCRELLLKAVNVRKNFLQFNIGKLPWPFNMSLWHHQQMALHKPRITQDDSRAFAVA